MEERAFRPGVPDTRGFRVAGWRNRVIGSDIKDFSPGGIAKSIYEMVVVISS